MTGARLQRGIQPADCVFLKRADANSPQLSREERKERLEQRRAAEREFCKEMRAEYSVIMGRVLELTLAYEQHLTWVDLKFWRESRALRSVGLSAYGLASFYFQRFTASPGNPGTDTQSWPAVQTRLQGDFAPIATLSAQMDPYGWRRIGGVDRGPCALQERHYESPCTLPHPICVDKLLVRIHSCYSDPFHPLFDPFDALARRVEARLLWEQPGFGW